MSPKSIVITGCGPGGIGTALATEFHRRGHRVVASGLSHQLLEHFGALGIDTVIMDVTSQESIDGAVKEVSTATGGKLDILINNAGMLVMMPFADTPMADMRRLIDVNVVGVMAVTQAFLPLLMASDEQSVVASLGSVNAVFNPPYLAAYNASKAFVESFGRTIRRELAPFNIRVVTLKTGSVRTNLFNNAPATKLPEGSLYTPIKKTIEERDSLKSASFMELDTYAKQVVDELLRPTVKAVIWKGGLVLLAWIMSWFGWETMLDSAMISESGLGKLARPAAGSATKRESQDSGTGTSGVEARGQVPNEQALRLRKKEGLGDETAH